MLREIVCPGGWLRTSLGIAPCAFGRHFHKYRTAPIFSPSEEYLSYSKEICFIQYRVTIYILRGDGAEYLRCSGKAIGDGVAKAGFLDCLLFSSGIY